MFGFHKRETAAVFAALILAVAMAGCRSESPAATSGSATAQADATFPIMSLPNTSSTAAATEPAPAQTGEEDYLPQSATVELVLAGQSIHTVTVADSVGKKVLMDAIFNHMIRSAAWPGDDPDKIPNRIIIRTQFNHDDGYPTEYHVFVRDGQPCMQAGRGMYNMISEEVYKPLRELVMGYGLPDTMTIWSGNNEIKAMAVPVNPLSSARGVTPQIMADLVQYLELDPKHMAETMTPFTPTVGGRKVYGVYGLYNERFEQLKSIMPSGLEPQTYLFLNAEPGRYIVVLQTTDLTESDSKKIIRQYFFGVIVPENYHEE